VILVGLPRVGKTSLARQFEDRGFIHVSVGGIVRSLFYERFGKSGTRIELLEFGITIANRNNGRDFLSIIVERINQHAQFVIDGPRPIQIVSDLRKIYAAVVCELVCDEVVVARRLSEESPCDPLYAEKVLGLERRLMGGQYSCVSDITVENSDSVDAVIQKLTRYSYRRDATDGLLP
jgi:hypothetical protein